MGKIISMGIHTDELLVKRCFVMEAICVKCTYRWVAVFNEKVLMKNLECPGCKHIGSVIATGQILEGD